MRITNNMLVNSMMYYMGNNLSRMEKYQSQLATGKKISVPSDDPIVAAKSLKLRTDVSEVDQFKKNSNDAYSWMDITENTLGKTVDILQRTRELAVQGANGTLTLSDKEKIKQEITQLRGQAIHLANSTYAGRFIFSGFATDSKLMEEDGTYACTVSSNETAVIKGGLVDLSLPGESVDTATANSFEISVDGSNYSTITIGGGPYDGSAGNTLEDVAAAIQSAIIATGDSKLENIKVESNDGRIEFSLRNTVDTNGNRLKLYLQNGAVDDLLGSINLKTDPVTKLVVSKSEDINYQVGISDMLNINVLGTDLYGSGKKGDVGEFMSSMNNFIDALTYPSDSKSYLSSQSLVANIRNPIDLTDNNQFSIEIGGMGGFSSVSLPNTVYDGTPGKTVDDLASDMETAINGVVGGSGYTVSVVNQNGKLLISEASGAKITLKEGAPGSDALNPLKLHTNSTKTVSSVSSYDGLQNAIASMESLKDRVMSIRSDIGARMNRAELTLNRLESDTVNFTKLMSDNEDVDMAETIMKLQNEENVYKASLAGGARIIMPTLIDFLR